MITLNNEKNLQQHLNKYIFNIGHLAQDSLCGTLSVLRSSDNMTIQDLIKNSTKIDELQIEISKYYFGMIEKYNYRQRDLQYMFLTIEISAKFKIIADLLVNIYKYALMFGVKFETISEPLKNIFIITQNMLWNSMVAFLKLDVILSKGLQLSFLEFNKSYNIIKMNFLNDCESKDRLIVINSVKTFMIIKYIKYICENTINISNDILCFLDIKKMIS